MKKGIKNLAIATMVGVASMGLMTGCKKEEDKPYIQVSGLDTAFIQNEDINLEGAKILYYSDKNDTTADEIALTESMIANFSTDTIGEKKMKVLWNGFELEVNYSVISTTDFINLYNAAYDNLMNAENVHGDVIVTQDGAVGHTYANVSNNKLYSYKTFNGEIKHQEWIERYSGKWYEYQIEGEDKTRYDITEYMIENNIMKRGMTYFISSELKLENSDLEYFENITIDFDGNKTNLILTNVDLDSNETIVSKSIIENGKFVGVEYTVYREDGSVYISVISTISYNAEDVEMVDLPTDVVWDNVVEE